MSALKGAVAGEKAMAETVYSRKQIDDWQHSLDELAQMPRTSFTKKQAVEELIEHIEKALLAHSYEEVAERLTADGLEISPGTLKQYVNAFRRALDKGSSKGKRRRGATGKSSGKQLSGKKQLSSEKKGAKKTGQQVVKKLDEPGPGHDSLKRFLEMDEDL